MYLLPGVIGFIFFIFFDLNKIYWKSKFLNLFFVLGSALLAFSTGYSIWESDFQAVLSHFGFRHLFLLACLILSVALLIYTLFFALPFNDTYVQSDDLPLINKGVYGTCRHPGFWPFACVYFFLAWLFLSKPLWYCFLLYSTCNFLYIVIQDRFIFPRYIKGYNEYKKTVPFIIPNRNSIRNAFAK